MITLRAEISMNVLKAQAAMQRFDRSVRRFDRDVGAPLRRATSNLARFTAMGAIMGTTLLGAGLNIAGTFDQINIRLRTVMGSAEAANKAFAETFDLFVRSPQYLMPLVEARTLLQSFGVGGAAELRSVADAAAIMGRDVRHVALALGSMETRPLRRLGINAQKMGEKFKFAFQDKTGKAIEVTAKGLENARRKVLEILNIKFGGGLEEMAKTWTGATSTLIGASQAVVHKALGPLKDSLIPILMAVNNQLIKLATDGSENLDLLGDKLRDFVMPYVKNISKVILAYNMLSDAHRTQLNNILKVTAAFIIAWKAGFIAPMLKTLALLATGQAAAFAPLLKTIAVVAAAKYGYNMGKNLLAGMKDATAASEIDTYGKFLLKPLTDMFKKENWIPEGPIKQLLDNISNVDMANLPEITASGTFAAQLTKAREELNAINGLMNFRGALAGQLPDVMPEPDRRMRLQFDKAAALEGQQRITNRLIAEGITYWKAIAEAKPNEVSFATP